MHNVLTLIVIVYFLGISLQESSLVAGLERSVNVDVSAQWPRYQGSFAAEISEFLAEESPDLFWDDVQQLCELPEASQTAALETAQALLPPSLHTLLDTVVGLSVYAPAVEFFRALSMDFYESSTTNANGDHDDIEGHGPCGTHAWAVIYPGRYILCDSSELLSTLTRRSDSNSIFDVTSGHAPTDIAWDHQWSSSRGASRATGKQHIVVYGTLGSKSFCNLHQTILSAIDSTDNKNEDLLKTSHTVHATQPLFYSVRHAFPDNRHLEANITHLQGFGVFLDIKNMEYKNVDDADGDGSSSNGSIDQDQFPVGEDIAGVVLSTLLEIDPSVDMLDMALLKDELKELDKGNRRILGDDTHGEELDITQMKVWKMKDLGVQCVHSVLNSEVSRGKHLIYLFPFLKFLKFGKKVDGVDS